MPAQPARYPQDATEAVVHDLPPIRFDGQLIPVRLQVRRAEDAIWRGRVLFGAADTEGERATAEIFCATSEPELWQSVRDLRDHHLRDLYRSLLQMPDGAGKAGGAGGGRGGDTIRKLRHDLSNPLAAILAETQLLLLGAEKYDADTVAGLKQIEALSRKMRGMLEALDR